MFVLGWNSFKFIPNPSKKGMQAEASTWRILGNADWSSEFCNHRPSTTVKSLKDEVLEDGTDTKKNVCWWNCLMAPHSLCFHTLCIAFVFNSCKINLDHYPNLFCMPRHWSSLCLYFANWNLGCWPTLWMHINLVKLSYSKLKGALLDKSSADIWSFTFLFWFWDVCRPLERGDY